MNKINLIIDTESQDTIDKSFKRIAEDMLNNFVIKLNDVQYRILNIEFYYYNLEKHPDCNVHQNQRQLESHKWYLHKYSINPKYHRKGIDYTFGHNGNYGGILIKEVRNLTTNEILTQSNFINDLVKELKFNHPKDGSKFKELIEKKNVLKLELNKSNTSHHKIESKERIGLAKPSYKDNKYAFLASVPSGSVY